MYWIRMTAAMVFLACGTAMAAVYGDFYVPDELNAHLVESHGNGVQLAFPSSSSQIIIHLPLERQLDTGAGPLQIIATQLAPNAPVHVMNFGGRPWFGVRRAGAGAQLYSGYAHRHGAIYNIALGMDASGDLDAEVKAIFARIRIIPNLENASPMLPAILDMADRGEWDSAIQALQVLAASQSGEWLPWSLLGEMAEASGDTDLSYSAAQRAAMLQPEDAESASRFAMLESLGGDAESGMAWSVYLASEFPDEPVVWRDMGKAALGGQDGELAMEYFQEALAVNPADEASLYNMTFLAAQSGDYENALRYGRDLLYYFPWTPSGTIPDVTTAPGMSRQRVEEILREPLSPGRIPGRSAGGQDTSAAQAHYPTPQDINTVWQIIHVPVDRADYGVGYSPVFYYDWSWTPILYRPWWGTHRPRPPVTGWRPGGPGIVRPRPPSFRPPGGSGMRPRPPTSGNRPGGNRPRPPITGGTGRPRPPAPGGQGPRPPVTGVRPVPPIGDVGGTVRPTRPVTPPATGGGRPTPGIRPPTGGAGGGTRPTRPISPSTPGGDRPTTGIVPLPAPARPPQGGGSASRPGVNTSRPGRPAPAPAAPVTRPATRPAPQPQVRPTVPPTTPARPAPSTRPAVRPEQAIRPGSQGNRPAPNLSPDSWDKIRQARPGQRPTEEAETVRQTRTPRTRR